MKIIWPIVCLNLHQVCWRDMILLRPYQKNFYPSKCKPLNILAHRLISPKIASLYVLAFFVEFSFTTSGKISCNVSHYSKWRIGTQLEHLFIFYRPQLVHLAYFQGTQFEHLPLFYWPQLGKKWKKRTQFEYSLQNHFDRIESNS